MIRVIAAVMERDGAVLICRRKNKDGSAGQWEFPGGKLEAGETEAQCLVRELWEELGVSAAVGEKLGEASHDYGGFSVRVAFYRADIISGEITLHVHADALWAEKGTLPRYDFLAADVDFVKRRSESK